MPAFTSFVPMVSERWVPLCAYREDRQSLIMQLTQGVALLGFDTSGPLVPSVVGPVPCGVWHSVDTGNGPGAFRLSKQLDGDLVKQSWYGWTKFPNANAIPEPWTQHVIPGATPVGTFVIAPTLPLVVLVVHLVSTGGTGVFVDSANLGRLSQVFGNSVPDAGGDFGQASVFAFEPGSSDTITITALSPCLCVAYVCSVNGALGGTLFGGLQGFGVNSALLSNNIVTTTAESTVALKQPALALAQGYGPAVSFTYTGNILPVTSLAPGSEITDPLVSPDATTWLLEAVISQTTLVGVPTSVTITHNAVQDAVASAVLVFNLPSPRRMCVIEAFDELALPPPRKTFTVELPKLSPDALAAFQDLVKRIQSGQEASP